ncbi:MAG: DUF493 family protein [Flavobacteriaceae bacterium]|nr:DUF493 family protein [Flavobacteriaceae bacterium]
MNKSDKFYDNLIGQLKLTSSWPNSYLFKFIIQSNLANSNDLRNIFNDLKPEISLKSSKNNKYTSISIKVFIDSPEEIVKRYKEVGDKIKGVISL